MEGNIELSYTQGNYAVNFDGKFPTYCAFCMLMVILEPVVNMIMWSSIEACASVICASLPCYAPLLKKAGSIGTLFTSLRSVFSLPKKNFSSPVSSKRSTQKETSSLEKIIPNTTDIESGTQDDIKGGGRATEIKMGRIRRATLVDIQAGISEPLPHSPCLGKTHFEGVPSYGSQVKLARVL